MRSEKIVVCSRCNGAGRFYQTGKLVECPLCEGKGETWQEFDSKALDKPGCSFVLAALLLVIVSTIGIGI